MVSLTNQTFCPVKLTAEILVWLANIRPLTLWADGMYGDFLESATCILAGPQGINWASFRSRILCKLLCTWKIVEKVMYWTPV